MTKEEEYKQIMELVNTQKLEERMRKCQMVFQEFGEENFYISFSGGKDSMVMHELIDLACPGNTIPRVYADTGIEYEAIRSFVKELAEKDDRFVIIKPSVPIKQMLENVGYPFKSKFHSDVLYRFQNSGKNSHSVRQYLGEEIPPSGIIKHTEHLCPQKLRYQFEPDFTMKVSPKCCAELKKKPLANWQKEHGIKYAIVGVMRSEGGSVRIVNALHFKAVS